MASKRKQRARNISSVCAKGGVTKFVQPTSLEEAFCLSLVLPLSVVLSTCTSSLKIPLNSSGGQRVGEGKNLILEKGSRLVGWGNVEGTTDSRQKEKQTHQLLQTCLDCSLHPVQKGLSITPENSAWRPCSVCLLLAHAPLHQDALGNALQREWVSENVHKNPEVGRDCESCVHGLHTSTLSQQTRLKANGVPDAKHKHPGLEVRVHCLIKALSSKQEVWGGRGARRDWKQYALRELWLLHPWDFACPTP